MNAPDEVETGALIGRARAGDRSACDELFARFGPRVSQVAALRVGLRLQDLLVEHEDLVQDTLLAAFQDLERFEHRGPGSFLRWLVSILENRIRNTARQHEALKRAGDRRVLRLSEFQEQSQAWIIAATGQTTPSEAAQREELRQRIEAAFLALSEHQRRALDLRKLCGCPYSTVKEELGLPSEMAARQLVSRALAKVSARL